MSKVITIKEANISTLNVELKAIHINSKQMTLSVFRQIQEETLFDDKFNLLGVPWGSVNYFWDKALQFNTTVLHVVWQKGNELRRWRFSNLLEGDGSSPTQFLYGLNQIARKFWTNAAHELSSKKGFITDKNERVTLAGKIIKSPAYYEKDGVYLPADPDTFSNKWRIERENERKEAYQLSVNLANSYRQLIPSLEEKVKIFRIQEADYINNYRAAYQQLTQLPQLYIAA